VHQRKFTVVYDLAGDEVYSRIQIRRTDQRAAVRFRERRKSSNWSIFQVVFPPLPAGVSTFRPEVVEARRAGELAWQSRRSRIYENQLLPEAVVTLPDGELQEEYRTAMRAKRWEPWLAWTKRRQTAIEGSLNKGTFNYPMDAWGEPLGEMLGEIQQHMLEVFKNRGLFFYDSLWTSEEILRFVENRTNQFLLQTGIVRETASQSVGTNGQVILPTTSNVLRRAIFTSSASATFPLELGDYHKADAGNPGWESGSGEPERLITWGKGLAELEPKPSAAGTLLLDYVPTYSLEALTGLSYGDGHSPTDRVSTRPGALATRRVIGKKSFVAVAIDTLLPVPGNFVPYIKYGTMADMLSKEGEAHDEDRAKYCEGRFTEGIELAKMWMGRTD